MVRWIIDKLFTYDGDRQPLHYRVGSCNSTDLPLDEEGFVTGSRCHVVDAGTILVFDEELSSGSKWDEQISLKD